MILDHLDRDLFEPVVGCPADSQLAEFVRARQIPVVGIPNLTARFTWNPFRLAEYLQSYAEVIKEFRNVPRRERIDLIHANSVRAGLLATVAMAWTGIPVIWHLHDMMERHPFSTAIRWVTTIAPPVFVIAVSRAAAERFRGWSLQVTGGRTPIVVLHNPVDSQRFHPNVAGRKHARELLGLRDEQFVFAVIGQVTPRKGQMETIQAFSEMARSVPNAVLVIVGAALFNHDHEYLNRLRSTVTKLNLADRVLFLGQQRDINALLGAVDGVIINSRREPFALIALEALAAGKPVVAADVDGIPELIEGGVTGLLTTPGDRHALASALRTLCLNQELCRKLSSKGRGVVEKNFNCSGYAQALAALYDAALNKPVVASQDSCSHNSEHT
jgi:glycosyltransferase involved in cell wall biosynthesis